MTITNPGPWRWAFLYVWAGNTDMCAVQGELGNRIQTTWPPAPRPRKGVRSSHARMLGKKLPYQNTPPQGPPSPWDTSFASEYELADPFTRDRPFDGELWRKKSMSPTEAMAPGR